MENKTVKTNKEIKEELPPLQTPIGTREPEKLKPGIVKIDSISIDDVENKEGNIVGKKAVCLCKHPDKDELVAISSAKYQFGDKLKIGGLWFNKDKDGNIPKNSALAHLMKKTGAETPSQLSGKEVETIKDDKEYLCFKVY